MQKYRDALFNQLGVPIVGASVLVTTYPAGAVATIYTGNGSGALANPMTTDSLGQFSFYAADGRYTLTISGSGLTVESVMDVLLEDSPATLAASGGAALVGFNPAGGLSSTNVQAAIVELAGTVSGKGTVSSVAVATANGVSASITNPTTTPSITLTLGAITPTTVNGNTITTGTGVLTLAAAKTLAVSNTLTLAGTDGTVMTFPSTSATIARTDAANTFTGTQTMGAAVVTTMNGNTVPTGADTVAMLATAQTFTKAQRGQIVTLTDASTIALDLSFSNQYQVQLAGNRTLGVPTNVIPGHVFDINVYQDTTGSRTLAYTWIYSWFGGTAGTLSTTGCTQDLIGAKVDAYKSGTMTTTIATPGIGTLTGHQLFSGQKCQITTTGALPTGLTASTTYYLHIIDADTFHFCTSVANVNAGTYIATSGSQSGTHTIIAGKITLNMNKASS